MSEHLHSTGEHQDIAQPVNPCTAAAARVVPAAPDLAVAGFCASQVRPAMRVVDAEGMLLGTVSAVESDRIVLSALDAAIPLSGVAGVEAGQVRLSAAGAEVPLTRVH